MCREFAVTGIMCLPAQHHVPPVRSAKRRPKHAALRLACHYVERNGQYIVISGLSSWSSQALQDCLAAAATANIQLHFIVLGITGEKCASCGKDVLRYILHSASVALCCCYDVAGINRIPRFIVETLRWMCGALALPPPP